jgi:hypothetical protein
LPLQYDATANNAALANVAYSSDIQGYKLDGTIKDLKKDGEIFIEFNNKTLMFLFIPNAICTKKVIKNNLQDRKQVINEVDLCDHMLTINDIGKKVSVTFFKTSTGYNIIEKLRL